MRSTSLLRLKERPSADGWPIPAAHRLRLDAGRRGIAEWESENGPLTTEELAEGLVRARALLERAALIKR